MVSVPTYESYCRERKATLDKERSVEQSRSMSEVVDDILEIISTDEDVLKKTRQEASILTSQSSCATWSLSSSAIVTSWPSSSVMDDDEDGFDNLQKSIQSYTSQLFSPLYEVRLDQHNVFQENRQPLPKPGYTPKVRNLCYNLGTDLSYDQADNYSMQSEYRPIAKNKYASSNEVPCTTNERIHTTTDRILLNVSPLEAMTATEVQARDMNGDQKTSGQFSHPSQHLLYDFDDDNIERDNFTPVQTGREADKFFNHMSINNFTLTNYNFYARNDWLLKTYSSVDSGELSLEPLLNAYSEEFNPISERIIPDKILTSETLDLRDESNKKGKSESIPTDFKIQISNEVVSTNQFQSLPLEKSEETQTSSSSTEIVEFDQKHEISQFNFIPQAIENVQIKNYAFLQQITIDTPLTPSLLYAIDTSLISLQSMISTSFVRFSVSVRLDKKEIASEGNAQNASLPNILSLTINDSFSRSNKSGCSLLDSDTFCTPTSAKAKKNEDNGCSLVCGYSPHKDKKTQETSTRDTIDHLTIQTKPYIDDIVTMADSEGLGSPSYTIPQVSARSYSSQSDSNAEEIVDNFIRSIGLNGTLGYDIDNEDESMLNLSDSVPTSFDSEQFLKDMALRIESEVTQNDGSYIEDDTSTSSLFQKLSLNFISSSCESNDGLDEEICALEMFEADLKHEIAKANNSSFQASLTSPIQAVLSMQSSSCSMTTTFLTERNCLSCQSSDEDLITVATPNRRKVHFNVQVEEFLYLSYEACGTPDATASERQKNDETFMDEICNVFDDILDELSYACISISRAMDRTSFLSKNKEIRRSSVC
jgi:hypothetical protein